MTNASGDADAETATRETIGALAHSLASNPLASFAAGASACADVHQASQHALQAIFTHAVQSESHAAPHIVPFLHSIQPEPQPNSSSRKRKRGANGPGTAGKKKGRQADQENTQPEAEAAPSKHSLFQPTPISTLLMGPDIDADQLWAQLELRTEPLTKMIHKLIVIEQLGEDEQDADSPSSGEGDDAGWFTDDESDAEGSDASSEVELGPDAVADLIDHDDDDDDDEFEYEDDVDGALEFFDENGQPLQLLTTVDAHSANDTIDIAGPQSTPSIRSANADAIEAALAERTTPIRVRFHKQVAVRQIPPRRIRPGEEDDDDDSDDEMDGEFEEGDDDEDEDDEDEGEEFDGDDEEGKDGQQRPNGNGVAAAANDLASNEEEDAQARKPFGVLAANEDDGDDDDDPEGDDNEDDIDLFQDVLHGPDADNAEADADAHFADFFGRPARGGPKAGAAARTAAQPVEEDDLDADLDEDLDEDGMDEWEDEENDDDEDMDDGDDADGEAGFDEEGTAKRVANDLFAEEADEEQKGTEKMSRFEKRQAALRDEIAALERENVSKKDWTLRGEVGAPARPLNSLLEEDLAFEQSAKRAPVVTEETTRSLEDVIKARILEARFDDVQRRYAGGAERDAFLPSRMLELSDAKSGKSLAELYEDEYQAGEAGASSAAGSEADRKLAAEHEVIGALFEEVCGKLDALSNAHYTPKAPKATIQTLSNTPTISLESALPALGPSAASTLLAPEEVFAPAQGSSSTALIGAKSEMTPEEKQGLHERVRREKKRRNERIERVRRERERERVRVVGGDVAAVVSPGAGGGGTKAKGKKGEKEAKDAALKKLIGNKGVSVIGKDGKTRTGKNALGDKDKTKGKNGKTKTKGAAEGSGSGAGSGSRDATRLKL